MNAVASAGASGDWTWLFVVLGVGALIAIAFFLHRKFPTQTAKVAADAQAGANDLAHKLADALKDSINKQPAPVPATVLVIPPQPIGAPAMITPTVIPLLFKGKERDPDYVYPDEPGYDWKAFDGGGPGANYKGEPLRRQWLGLPRADHGNPNYVDGQPNITPATEEQKALARETSAKLGVDNPGYLAAYNALLASCGGNPQTAAAIINAYSTSES